MNNLSKLNPILTNKFRQERWAYLAVTQADPVSDSSFTPSSLRKVTSRNNYIFNDGFHTHVLIKEIYHVEQNRFNQAFEDVFYHSAISLGCNLNPNR